MTAPPFYGINLGFGPSLPQKIGRKKIAPKLRYTYHTIGYASLSRAIFDILRPDFSAFESGFDLLFLLLFLGLDLLAD